MQVFKACLKVIQKNAFAILIYFCIFIAISIVSSVLMPTNQVFGNFENSKFELCFISHDEDSELLEGFREYLQGYAEFKEIPEDNLQDALFYRNVEYIMMFPDGFTEDFLAGKEVQMDKMTIPGSSQSYFADQLTERYFGTAKLYLTGNPDISQKELTESLANDLSLSTSVTIEKANTTAKENNGNINFFNMLAYAIIGIFTLSTSSIVMVFNKTDLRRRNLCSPIRQRSMNAQMATANVLFCLLMWMMMMAIGIFLMGKNLNTNQILLYLLNSFIFSMVGIAFGYLCGMFVKSKEAQGAITNVLSLGLCFFSGAFVPQETMSQPLLTVASFTPTYWFVCANNEIDALGASSFATISPILSHMLIQVGFVITIFAIALVVSKQKRTSQA